jgi:hypothetical protein
MKPDNNQPKDTTVCSYLQMVDFPLLPQGLLNATPRLQPCGPLIGNNYAK